MKFGSQEGILPNEGRNCRSLKAQLQTLNCMLFHHLLLEKQLTGPTKSQEGGEIDYFLMRECQDHIIGEHVEWKIKL